MDTPVLIVGAGPTGLLLAAELRRRGVECTLIDSREEPQHWDRATIVHPRSLEVFAALGIVDDFVERGVHQRGIRIYSDGEVLGELDLAFCGSPYGFNLNLSEEETEAIIERFLREQGGEVRRGCRLVDLEPGPDQVLATIEEHGERRQISAGWVVGCDGLHSPTRELSGMALEGHDIADPWAVFDVTLANWASEYDFNFGYFETTPVILTPLPEQRWRVYMRPTSPDSDLVAEAAAVIGRYDPGAELVDVANPTRFDCHAKVADRYRTGRVLIAGDAAHVCTPAQGHGMNSGIQDAFNLGWKLALVVQGAAGEGLLDSYGPERRPVAQMITASGDAAERLQSLAATDHRAVRDRRLREALTDPDSSHHEVVAEVELDISYAGSPIVSGAGGAVGAGERLPVLQELTQRGPDHTLLVLADGPEGEERLLRLLDEAEAVAADGVPFDPVVGLSSGAADDARLGRLESSLVDEIGVDGVTVLAVRPDGHVGMRSDGFDLTPLRAYLATLRSGV